MTHDRALRHRPPRARPSSTRLLPAGHGGTILARSPVEATLHCLTGCAIGVVLGMVLATWWGWSNGPTVVLSVVLAFGFGCSLTMRPVLAAGVGLRQAVGVALAADTVSIGSTELLARGRGHEVVREFHR